MITLFTIGMILFICKMISFAFRCCWSLTKCLLYIVFLPVILIGMFVTGLAVIALPALIIAMIFMIGRMALI